MSLVQNTSSTKPNEAVMSYKDCLMSGAANRSSPVVVRAGDKKPSVTNETEALPISHETTLLVKQVTSEHMAVLEQQIAELSSRHASLTEQTQKAFSDIKKMLDQKEKEVLTTYQTTFDYKLGILTKYQEKLTAAAAATSASVATSPETAPPNSPHLPSPPTLSGGTFCGFVPEMTNLVHSTVCLMLEHREEVGLGVETKASIIGSITAEGIFWVRILPDESGVQDVMLLNMSNTIGVELSLSPPSPLKLSSVKVGDLCCALYADDQRWYRAKVVKVTDKQKAKVYFVDYGNVEVVAFSNLYPIHPKFLVYPFQMIQCCFSDDPELSYERELRWKFTDLTHGSNLSVKIVELLPSNVNGSLHRVQLTNHSTGGEPFEVGAIVTLMAQASLTKAQASTSIKYRDIRYAGKTPIQQQTIVNACAPEMTSTPISKSMDTGETNVIEEEKKKDVLITKEAEISSEGYFTTSSEGAVSISSTSCDALQLTTPTPSEKTTPTSGSHKTIPISCHDNSTSGSFGRVTKDEELEVPHIISRVEKEETVQLPGNGKQEDRMIASAAQIKVAIPNYSEVVARPRSHSPVPSKTLPPPVIVDESKQKVNGFSRDATPVDVCNDHSTLKQGEKCEVFVTSPLSVDGTFWVQLASTEEPVFLEMVELLQQRCTEEPPTPVFFSPGDLCAALFSEDECWYRACVEEVINKQFMVRYLDFGNSELRGRDSLMALGSEFREIPFQAVCCSIATADHPSFSEKEIERFNQLTTSQRLVITVLVVEKGKATEVQLHLKLSDMGTVNLNEEICTADFKVTESISFSSKEMEFITEKELAQTEVESPDEPSPTIPSLTLSETTELTSTINWADTMDELQSPQNDGIFTIAGQESRSTSHTPTPSVPFRNTPSPQPLPPPPPRNHAPSPPSTSSSPMPTYSSRLRNSPSPILLRELEKTREGGVACQSSSKQNGVITGSAVRCSSVPRIHSNVLGMLRKNLLIAESEQLREKRARSDQPLHDTSTSGPDGVDIYDASDPSHYTSSAFSLAVPPGLPQPKGMRSLNQITRNGTSFPPSGRRRKSPDPDSTQVKLFVRYMPHSKSMEEVYHLFSLYGHIHTLEYHTEHKDKLYLIMDKEGGMRSVKGLDGNHMVGSPKPLSVQPYKGTSTQSPEQAELDNLPSSTSTRLFVKNIPLDRTMEDVQTMFSHYGKVLGLVPIPSRKNVVYMYMDPKAAKVAIDNLHGKAISKYSKPMIVELSNPPRSSRS